MLLNLQLSKVSERERETNVGKMSTTGKSRSLGEGYIGGCLLYNQVIRFDKTKVKEGKERSGGRH